MLALRSTTPHFQPSIQPKETSGSWIAGVMLVYLTEVGSELCATGGSAVIPWYVLSDLFAKLLTRTLASFTAVDTIRVPAYRTSHSAQALWLYGGTGFELYMSGSRQRRSQLYCCQHLISSLLVILLPVAARYSLFVQSARLA